MRWKTVNSRRRRADLRRQKEEAKLFAELNTYGMPGRKDRRIRVRRRRGQIKEVTMWYRVEPKRERIPAHLLRMPLSVDMATGNVLVGEAIIGNTGKDADGKPG